ncbi:hypothetical protein [Prevotella fusca]
MGFFHTWQELFSLLRAHPSTLHDKAQVPVGKVYQCMSSPVRLNSFIT